MSDEKKLTGYPSIDKPWLKYYKTTHEPNDIPSPDCSMVDFLYQCNKNRLDNTALNYYGTRISFGRMFERIDQVASALRAYGVCKGDFVTLCALNTPEFVYLLYALNKIGAISNWIGLTSPCEDLHEQLVSTNTRVVFTISIAYHQIAEAAKGSNVERIITVPIEESMPIWLRIMVKLKSKRGNHSGIQWRHFVKSAQEKSEATPVAPNDLAIIEYTGGSTGVPKGVMLSNRNLNSYYCNLYKTNESFLFAYNEKDTYLGGVPLFLAYGISAGCHAPLAHSMELVLSPDPLLMCDKEAIEVQKILPFLSDTWPLCRIGRAVIRASQSCRQSCNKSQCPACGCRSHHSCTHAPQFSRSFPAREWGSVLQRQGACGQCP